MTDAPLDDLFDDIHNAMLDVHDMDSGLGHYAQAVVNSLRNASPAAFAELGPVKALIAGAIEAAQHMARNGPMIVAPDNVPEREALDTYRNQIVANLSTLTPANALAAVQAMVDAAEKRGADRERERCAKVAEATVVPNTGMGPLLGNVRAENIAAAIRGDQT